MRSFKDFKNDIDDDPELRMRYIEILDRMSGEDGEITPEMSAAAAAELGYEADADMFEQECRDSSSDEEINVNDLGMITGGISFDDFMRKWLGKTAR